MRLVEAQNPLRFPGVLTGGNTARRADATASPQRHVGRTPSRGPARSARPATPRVADDAGFNPAQAFAALVSTHIEGGRAGIVRPEARRGLMRAALAAGLRPFDATLIIAMVQDRARRGEPLGESARDPRLVAVKVPEKKLPLAALASAALTVTLAASMFALVITWLAGV